MIEAYPTGTGNRAEMKEEFTRLFFIGFGVFLFILFFQPFPLNMLDSNNRLLFVTGLGAITFISECIVLVLIPFLLTPRARSTMWEYGPPLYLHLVLLLVNSTAFTFYIRYVGMVNLTLYIIFKILLVCLIPLIILVILYKNRSLERQISLMKDMLSKLNFKDAGMEQKKAEGRISLSAENSADKISLTVSSIIMITSADNYIEVHYLAKDTVEKKLLRNTLKNIEIQLNQLPMLLRCHRTCIVNMDMAEKLIRNYNGYTLKMKDLQLSIPVARQYVNEIREALSTKEQSVIGPN